MKNLWYFCFLLLFAVIDTTEAEELVHHDALGVSFDLPAGFTPMPDAIKRLKYPSIARHQNVAYQSAVGDRVSVAVGKKAGDRPITLSSAMVRSMKRTIGLMRNVKKWNAAELVSVGGQPIAYLDFVTPATDSDAFDIVNVTLLTGRGVIINISCVTVEEELCNRTIDHIEKSLSFHPN